MQITVPMTERNAFEAVNYALRKSRDGVIVSFVVHPNDVTPELMALPVGARVMIGWAQVGDDEKPVARDLSLNTLGDAPAPELPQVPKEKDRVPFHKTPLWKQCVIRCGDPKFRTFLAARDTPSEVQMWDADTAAEIVRDYLGVTSRSQLGKSNHDADNNWYALESEYQRWLTDHKYADSINR